MSTDVLHVPQAEPAAAAHRAGGSSFYFAMRLMPRGQREAMFEIYSFCKLVDDIADGDLPRPQRLARLGEWRQTIDALYAGHAPSGLSGLAGAIARFGLQKKDFLAVIEGMEMDAARDIRAPSLDELDTYCDRVACAVGRLSVRVFGMSEPDGERLAHHLGRALQLTNILRDLDEDAGFGRLYLPREALHSAGIQTTDPKAAIADPRIGAACDLVIGKIAAHFKSADEILARTPRRAARAPRIMEAAYRHMFERLVARGFNPPRPPVRLSRSRLFGIALRYAIA